MEKYFDVNNQRRLELACGQLQAGLEGAVSLNKVTTTTTLIGGSVLPFFSMYIVKIISIAVVGKFSWE